MPYFNDLHTYLHQSSLLIQAYPDTRITTKYSLPRRSKTKSKDDSEQSTTDNATSSQPKREPSATLTLKSFHPKTGICLKYQTDRAAEVGRLLTGLGRLAKGEMIEMPINAQGQPTTADTVDKMDIDSGNATPKIEEKVATSAPAGAQTQGGAGAGGSKNKKKKGKK